MLIQNKTSLTEEKKGVNPPEKPQKKGKEGKLCMRCKYYRRKDTKSQRWVVYLYYAGKKWARDYYDEFLSLENERMALRISETINKDIEDKGEKFDPRVWFGFKPYELQFDIFCSYWFDNKPKERKLEPSTIANYRRSIELAVKQFGKQDLRTFDKIHIEKFKNSVEEMGLHSKTVRNHLNDLKTILGDAEDLYCKAGVVRPKFPKVKVKKPDKLSINRNWQNRILEKINEFDRPIFQFLVEYGVRTSEARALEWSDIDFNAQVKNNEGVIIGKGVITIRRSFGSPGTNRPKGTKTGKERVLPMTDEIRTMLKSLRERKIVGKQVFLNKRSRPYIANFDRIWNMARDEVECPTKVNLKQGTRTSFATQNASNPTLCQKTLGHENLSMTYSSYTDQPVSQILEMIQVNKK
jgi:integrase